MNNQEQVNHVNDNTQTKYKNLKRKYRQLLSDHQKLIDEYEKNTQEIEEQYNEKIFLKKKIKKLLSQQGIHFVKDQQ